MEKKKELSNKMVLFGEYKHLFTNIYRVSFPMPASIFSFLSPSFPEELQLP